MMKHNNNYSKISSFDISEQHQKQQQQTYYYRPLSFVAAAQKKRYHDYQKLIQLQKFFFCYNQINRNRIKKTTTNNTKNYSTKTKTTKENIWLYYFSFIFNWEKCLLISILSFFMTFMIVYNLIIRSFVMESNAKKEEEDLQCHASSVGDGITTKQHYYYFDNSFLSSRDELWIKMIILSSSFTLFVHFIFPVVVPAILMLIVRFIIIPSTTRSKEEKETKTSTYPQCNNNAYKSNNDNNKTKLSLQQFQPLIHRNKNKNNNNNKVEVEIRKKEKWSISSSSPTVYGGIMTTTGRRVIQPTKPKTFVSRSA